MSNLPLFTPKNSMGLTVSKLMMVSVKVFKFYALFLWLQRPTQHSSTSLKNNCGT
jgi:hypothetical protein